MILAACDGLTFDQRRKEPEVGRVIVTEFVSLDGVMEAPGGEQGYAHTGWTFDFGDAGQYDYKDEELQQADVQLLGRRTYQGFAAAWPEREDDPEDTAGFAKKMNAMPKYVVSTTLTEADATWNNTTILRSLDDVEKLREELDGNILVAGSNTLVHGLLERGLVDQLNLMIFPVILGSGKRVYPETPNKTPLKLTDKRSWDNGIVLHVYEPV
jgi:dihydrofolate reductase